MRRAPAAATAKGALLKWRWTALLNGTCSISAIFERKGVASARPQGHLSSAIAPPQSSWNVAAADVTAKNVACSVGPPRLSDSVAANRDLECRLAFFRLTQPE